MSGTNILIVEDDADIREGIRILLESEAYDVTEAENGVQGLELLREDTDLVILDIMMPGISGLKTCEEIRKKSVVPILFLTAKAQESDKLIGLMAGGDDYLESLSPMRSCWGASRPWSGAIRSTVGRKGPAGSRKTERLIWRISGLIWILTKYMWTERRWSCPPWNIVSFC